jgi:hypothetical protein
MSNGRDFRLISAACSFRSIVVCGFILQVTACSAEQQNTGNGLTIGSTNGTTSEVGGKVSPSSGGQGGPNANISFASGGGGASAGGGTANVSGQQTGDGGVTPVAINECQSGNAAGLSDAQVKKLISGSGPAGNMRWLYPYDGTVFPRGLLAPLLMWEGGPADAVYLHIQSKAFDYKGCFKPTAAGELQVPQKTWDTACAQTQGPSDPFTVELSVISTGTVTGPIAEKITISGGTLKGSVYYNTYNSTLVSGASTTNWSGFFGNVTGNGAVLRIPPGKQAEVFLGGGACVGCHSVSANGARLVAENWFVIGVSGGGSYAMTPTTAPNPPPLITAPSASFAGIYPDGSMYLSTANPSGTMALVGLAVGHNSNGAKSLLYETDTGKEIANTGIPEGALMPTFSPDGTLLAFNDLGDGDARKIAVMDFDAATRKASNYRVVYTDDSQYPGWPFFLPDNRGLIITRGDSAQFDGFGITAIAGIGSTIGAASDIYVLDLKTKELSVLANAMGFSSLQDAKNNKTYLPFGAEELHHNFFPTVSPVAAGGYFWVFFDSMRHYGNKGMARQIWGVAIDFVTTVEFSGSYADERSHPAFYLPGQEFGTGNHRAFTALDPCHKDGESCTTGIDCCSGFCTDGKCGRPKERCAKTDEACKSQTDCCNPADFCINGFCGQVLLR